MSLSLTPEKTITIRVDREGNTTSKAEGFKGNSCIAALLAYEKAIGPQLSRSDTAEMHEVEEQHVEMQSGDGESPQE